MSAIIILTKDHLFMHYTRKMTALPRGFALCLVIFSLLLFSSFVMTPLSYAQKRGSHIIIRDTEIEAILRSWAKPIIEAAGLEPDSVNFIIIQSPQINAFVAGGQNIFLYTGLLQEAESAEEIVGVIAHEVGHIRGGHLVRSRDALQNASYESLVGAIFGIGAAILTGESGFATLGTLGVSSQAQRRFLAFSRVQESTADQAALSYFEKAEMNPEGLMSFMQKLENQELLPETQQSEYIRTHPLTSNRVMALKHGLKQSAYKDTPYPTAWNDGFIRMKAKLMGFISPEQVKWTYNDFDKSMPAQYARAIAFYRQNKVEESLAVMDELLEKEPWNPFFMELKGQMLVDFSRVKEALPYYEKAVEEFPSGALIRIDYAHALIEAAGNDDQEKLILAIKHLQRAAHDEPRTSRVYRLLATAYGRLGETPLATLYLAEEALMNGQIPYAKRQAQTALHGLEEGSAPWIRAQDILQAIERAEKKRAEK